MRLSAIRAPGARPRICGRSTHQDRTPTGRVRPRTPLLWCRASADGEGQASAGPYGLILECDGVVLDTHLDGHREAFNRAFQVGGAGICVQRGRVVAAGRRPFLNGGHYWAGHARETLTPAPLLQEIGYDCVQWSPAVYYDLLRWGDGTGQGLIRAYFSKLGWPLMLGSKDRPAFVEKVYAGKQRQLRTMVQKGEIPLRPGGGRWGGEAGVRGGAAAGAGQSSACNAGQATPQCSWTRAVLATPARAALQLGQVGHATVQLSRPVASAQATKHRAHCTLCVLRQVWRSSLTTRWLMAARWSFWRAPPRHPRTACSAPPCSTWARPGGLRVCRCCHPLLCSFPGSAGGVGGSPMACMHAAQRCICMPRVLLLQCSTGGMTSPPCFPPGWCRALKIQTVSVSLGRGEEGEGEAEAEAAPSEEEDTLSSFERQVAVAQVGGRACFARASTGQPPVGCLARCEVVGSLIAPQPPGSHGQHASCS